MGRPQGEESGRRWRVWVHAILDKKSGKGLDKKNLHERSHNVYENKRKSDTMPERKADISAYLGDLRVTFVPNCTENGLHYGVRRTFFAQK